MEVCFVPGAPSFLVSTHGGQRSQPVQHVCFKSVETWLWALCNIKEGQLNCFRILILIFKLLLNGN